MSQPNGASANGQSYQPPFQVNDQRPQDVGIHGIELYFPSKCISEEDLEKYDGVASGKYTIGLGQEYMAYVDDREDINSFLLSVTSNLLKKYNIDPRAIGRLEVGTETIIDKAKAAKTVLMDLFEKAGNYDIEGIDSKNACYGGTAALFNAVNWVESSSWDGRYALVVCGDIAIYAAGSARPAGGAGACAMLIGPGAPLVIEPTRSTFMTNSWDFYKPALASEYPEVDGPLTVTAYMGALQSVYMLYQQKMVQKNAAPFKNDFDFMCFHGPFGKQVQKAYARIAYIDYLADPENKLYSTVDPELSKIPAKDTLADKNIEKVFINVSKEGYKNRVWPGTACMRRLGNAYTASLYACLASLVDDQGASLVGKRVAMFSYGSGLAASFFAVNVKRDPSSIKNTLDLQNRFQQMSVRPCQEFTEALDAREKVHNVKSYEPSGPVEGVAPGSYYLVSVDEKYRRKYDVRS